MTGIGHVSEYVAPSDAKFWLSIGQPRYRAIKKVGQSEAASRACRRDTNLDIFVREERLEQHERFLVSYAVEIFRDPPSYNGIRGANV